MSYDTFTLPRQLYTRSGRPSPITSHFCLDIMNSKSANDQTPAVGNVILECPFYYHSALEFTVYTINSTIRHAYKAIAAKKYTGMMKCK